MAIEKMRFVNISGLLTDFDRVLKSIVSDSEIHIEDANELFSKVEDLKSFEGINIYERLFTKIEEIFALIKQAPKYDKSKIEDIDYGKYNTELDDIISEFNEDVKNIDVLKDTLLEDTEALEELVYFADYSVEMNNFFNLRNISFRFGNMPAYNYKKIELYLGDINALVIPLKTDGETAAVMYFVSPFWKEQVDDTFKKLLFKRIRISDRVFGSPSEAKKMMEKELEETKNQIEVAEQKIADKIGVMTDRLNSLYSTILYNYKMYKIRAKVARGDKTYHLTGFMPEKFAALLETKINNDDSTIMLSKDPRDIGDLQPPTKLSNIEIVKPFEMFVNLFSLPAYNETDPTPMMAVVYSLLFGMMFADLGQGLVLSLLGFLAYKYKKMKLGGILAVAGLFSAFFGVMFGSVFGNEKILHPILINPMKDALTMSETLLASVLIGFLLIILAMIFNIVNAVKTKRVEELFTNKGMAGLIFYMSGGIIAVLSAIYEKYAASLVVTIVFLVVPLLLIYLREPLVALIEKKKEKFSGGYFSESFFELFETLLSYMSNTLSFVRVGAFALNHIGMMIVVYTLAEGAGAGKFPVIVIGNIIVMGIEGLLVGIQVLRLMFYEMFSKFYSGGGKDYKPFSIE